MSPLVPVFASVNVFNVRVDSAFPMLIDKLSGLNVKFKHSLYCIQRITMQTRFFERYADVDMESRYLRASIPSHCNALGLRPLLGDRYVL